MWQDATKGALEIIGAGIQLFNIVRIIRDKELKGVSFYYILFSVIANGYATYFYLFLGQWYSFFGVAIYTTITMLWAVLVLYYKGVK